MDIKDYKAGRYLQQKGYRAFYPSRINTTWTWSDPKINTLLSDANRALGELSAYSLRIPDIDYFIKMHVAKEATSSSKIEGTKTEIGDVILAKKEIIPEQRDDWQEVQNYIKAMNSAIVRLQSLPLSTRLLKVAHGILLSKGRGVTKNPGEYRTSQNWIGGATLQDATFIPPPHQEVNALMSDLETFLHNDSIDVPHLIRIALAHYQFETIHPFLDGNGRIGRLMITLYLVSEGMLTRPTLYISEYFEKYRPLYYDKLSTVRTSNDLAQWIKFFLAAITETSKKGIQTFEKIIRLREDIEERRLLTIGKKLPKAKDLLKSLYAKPSCTAAEISDAIHVTAATANALIRDFMKLGILKEMTGQMRNRRFVFHEYLDLFH